MKKKILTVLAAATMMTAMAFSAMAADPVATVDGSYTFTGGTNDQEGTSLDNPFKGKDLTEATVQYTYTIAETPTYLSGYDAVMTFGESTAAPFVYISNELVGENDGTNFVDFWPSGTGGTLAYPGAGETYTVNVVFTSTAVEFYLNGVKQENAATTGGTLTAADILTTLNTVDTVHIGSNGTSYWAPQDGTVENVKFFDTAVTEPVGVDTTVEDTTEADTTEADTTEADTTTKATTTADDAEDEDGMSPVVIAVIAVVAVVVVGGVVVATKKKDN